MVVARFMAVVGLIAAVFGGIWFFRWVRMQDVPPGHVGVLYSARNGVVNKIYPPGRLYVPFWHRLYTYPTRQQVAYYTQDPEEGETKAADGVQVTTKDNAITTFDLHVFYRVRPEDVIPKIFKTFGYLPIETIQSTFLRRAVKSAVQAVGTERDAFSLIGTARESANTELTQLLKADLAPKGIWVENAYLDTAYPAPALLQKIETRVTAQTGLTIAELDRQIAGFESQAAIVKSRAEARSRQISAGQTREQSLEMLSLQIQDEALDHWNGYLSPIQSRSGQIITLNPGALTESQAAAAPAAEPETPAAPAQPARTDQQGGQ